MIDLRLLRGPEAEKYKHNLLRKEPSFDLDKLLILEQEVRQLRTQLESLQAEKNKLSQQAAMSKGADETLRQASIQLDAQYKALAATQQAKEQALEDLALCCPNFLLDDVPDGNKAENVAVRSWGQMPDFAFNPKHHVELNEKAAWFDFAIGAKMSGSQFAFYQTFGTKVIYALTKLMLKHNAEHGFVPVLPPTLVSRQSFWRNGSLPKFDGDFYQINEPELSPISTAEVALTNLHTDNIYNLDQLPLRNTAWTSCFRKEAGGYGASERGLIRIHQFEKVELYSVCTPESSHQELELMVNVAEGFLQKLGLHYRVSLLAAQDASFVAAKTYDVEVWMPGQKAFYEVSSCSNCTDFQARRAKIRYRRSANDKPELAHTLNASSLALPRLMVALMETYQQADGSIKLPAILTQEMETWW